MQLCVYMCILASSQSFCSATQLLLDILLWLHLLATMNNAVRNTVLGICLPLSLILLGNKEWNCWIVCSLLDSIFNFLGTCQTVFQAAARFYVPASDAQLLHTLWTSCYFPFFFFSFCEKSPVSGCETAVPFVWKDIRYSSVCWGTKEQRRWDAYSWTPGTLRPGWMLVCKTFLQNKVLLRREPGPCTWECRHWEF